MSGTTIFFLKSIYGDEFDENDENMVWLYCHLTRAPGVELKAIKQIVLNFKAMGLRGQQLKTAFNKATRELVDDDAIRGLNDEEIEEVRNLIEH